MAAEKPRIFITKSRSGHYTATAILGRFRRSEGHLDSLRVARAAARDLTRQVEVDWLRTRVADKASTSCDDCSTPASCSAVGACVRDEAEPDAPLAAPAMVPQPCQQAQADATPARPLMLRTPTELRVRAREDHATCLVLAAHYRDRLARGEAAMRDRHAWALDHARTLRARFPGALSAASAAPG